MSFFYEITIVGPNQSDILLHGGESAPNNDRGNNENRVRIYDNAYTNVNDNK